MVFKYLTFTVDDDFLNTQPGSPPAFLSSPSVASPRACGGCIGVLSRFGELQLPDRFRDGGAVEEMLDENGSAGKGTRNAKKQSAGIPCGRKPHCWASADRSSQEEGQKNAKDRIGQETKTRLVRSVLSLPIPPDNVKSGEETTRDSLGQNDLHHKLLLVGFDKSGTSTIFKKAKILYGVPFSEEERQKMKLMVQSNLYCYAICAYCSKDVRDLKRKL